MASLRARLVAGLLALSAVGLLTRGLARAGAAARDLRGAP
jgi:hypothetical protein